MLVWFSTANRYGNATAFTCLWVWSQSEEIIAEVIRNCAVGTDPFNCNGERMTNEDWDCALAEMCFEVKFLLWCICSPQSHTQPQHSLHLSSMPPGYMSLAVTNSSKSIFSELEMTTAALSFSRLNKQSNQSRNDRSNNKRQKNKLVPVAEKSFFRAAPDTQAIYNTNNFLSDIKHEEPRCWGSVGVLLIIGVPRGIGLCLSR